MMIGGRSTFLKYQFAFLCCFGAFLVQLGAIWVLLKDMVCPWKSIFGKDGTV